MNRTIPRTLLLALTLAACADTAEPPEPRAARIEIVAGAQQTGGQGDLLPALITVRVIGSDGRPMTDVPVTWRVLVGGGEVIEAQAVSDAQGIATARWKLGLDVGSQLLLVSAPGADVSITAQSVRAFTVVAAGARHTCALTSIGVPYCWGGNTTSQLGDGTLTGRPTPALVKGGRRFDQLAAGWFHTCGLSGGEVLCWGDNTDGQVGVPGLFFAFEPSRVNLPEAVVQLSGGYIHTCAVTATGALYCWGSNVRSQRGVAGSGGATPVRVAPSLEWRHVSAGEFHTCALTVQDDAYCWGWNSSGEVGAGLPFGEVADQPVRVAGNLKFRAIATGARHTCAATTTSLYCWGRSVDGEIGTARFDHRSTPALVATTHVFDRLGAGNTNSCGLTGAGAVVCWGSDGFVNHPLPATINLPQATRLTVGYEHACAIAEFEVWCWGDNRFGQLGRAAPAGSAQPLKVSFPN